MWKKMISRGFTTAQEHAEVIVKGTTCSTVRQKEDPGIKRLKLVREDERILGVLTGYLQLQQLFKVSNPLPCFSSLPTTQFHTAGWGQRPRPQRRCFLRDSKGALARNLDLNTEARVRNQGSAATISDASFIIIDICYMDILSCVKHAR